MGLTLCRFMKFLKRISFERLLALAVWVLGILLAALPDPLMGFFSLSFHKFFVSLAFLYLASFVTLLILLIHDGCWDRIDHEQKYPWAIPKIRPGSGKNSNKKLLSRILRVRFYMAVLLVMILVSILAGGWYATFFEVRSFEACRAYLLKSHAFFLLVFLPPYWLFTKRKRVFWDLVKFNLFFIPIPESAEWREFGGGFSGGAGALGNWK